MRTKTEQVVKLQPTGETYTVDLYEFHELPADIQARIIEGYRNELAEWHGVHFADTTEREIWDAVHDLEKSITGARVEWRYNRWYSADFDIEFAYDDCYNPGEMDPAEDNGWCWSMGLCDVWNTHARKLNNICRRFDGVARYMATMCPYSWDQDELSPRDMRVYLHYDNEAEALCGLWYAELENACKDIADTIQGLLQCEWDYEESEEYARDSFEANEAGYECYTRDAAGRVYYHDTRKWYTIDGDEYEQANVNHACISIVKAG